MKSASKTATRIFEKRTEQSLTQSQLAKKAGCTREYINMLERARRIPSLTIAAKIATALGCKVDDLLR